MAISDDPRFSAPDPLPDPEVQRADPVDLEDPEELRDFALDFIEEAVGRLDFQRNWPAIGARQGQVIARWLASRRLPTDMTEPLRRQVDFLHRQGLRWANR